LSIRTPFKCGETHNCVVQLGDVHSPVLDLCQGYLHCIGIRQERFAIPGIPKGGPHLQLLEDAMLGLTSYADLHGRAPPFSEP